MKLTKRIGLVLAMVFLFSVPTLAGQDLVQTVADGCKAELESYCKDVKPGEGRILACLFAHQDKLSGKCEYALYDAAVQLERAVAALAYVVNECADDLDQHCSAVEAGEGRLLECIEKNDKKVSSRCKDALKEVGLKE
ncbi:MAG: cysteine rich repeat-containing protein [Desulfuromusa sp.]|nr:cysteine rich repeat-containing protein [Desulfuromusa sp.]